MPLKKSAIHMWKKFKAKYSPSIVETRLRNIRQVALERAQEGVQTVSSVRLLVNEILDQNGISGGERATYFAFATSILKHLYRQKGKIMEKIADGLTSYYANTYNLDEGICQEIVSALGITIQVHIDVYVTGSQMKIGEGNVTLGRPFCMFVDDTIVAEGIYPPERKFDVLIDDVIVGSGERC